MKCLTKYKARVGHGFQVNPQVFGLRLVRILAHIEVRNKTRNKNGKNVARSVAQTNLQTNLQTSSPDKSADKARGNLHTKQGEKSAGTAEIT